MTRTDAPAPGANGAKAAKVALDLDSLEREGGPRVPFTFAHEGQTYTLVDPQEIDWQELLMGMRNPALFMRYALSEEDQRKFLSAKVPSWKMNILMEKYQEHYGLPNLGELNALLR
jgi:hypothetical protein